MTLLLIILLAAPVSYLLSGLIRKNAARWRLIDIPNERSSHHTPVPRGGGLAIAFTFLALLPAVKWQLGGPLPLFLALFGAGASVTLLGFFDDRGHIPAHKRLLVHFAAGLWVLFQLYQQPVAFTYLEHPFNWALAIALLLFLVWLLNLYNFMDGIDAITGSETLSVCLGAALLSRVLLPEDPSWAILLLLLACVAGFQVWNLPPARLFMGDAGSASLGILLAALSIHAFYHSMPLFYGWLLLLGVYIVDATITLIRRILAGEKFHQAHRTHAYQHAALRHASHGRVSLGIALINLLWLLPLAAAVAFQVIAGPLALLLGYLPLVALAFHYGAGVRPSGA